MGDLDHAEGGRPVQVEQVLGPGGERLATVVRLDGPLAGLHFFSEAGDFLQLGAMEHPKEHAVAPHVHSPLLRLTEGTPEVLFVVDGMVRLDLYLEAGGRELVKRVRLGRGDAAVIHPGAVHGLVWLAPSRVVEVKLGPFFGPEADKIRGDP